MENLSLNLQGLAIGLCTFLIIGLFHPLVIKGEYYFGRKVNWAFLAGGIGTLVLALLSEGIVTSAILGIVAFSCFWSILEVNHQVRRVEKGWFPMNPKRRNEYKNVKDVDGQRNPEKKEACSFHNGQTSLTNISITEET